MSYKPPSFTVYQRTRGRDSKGNPGTWHTYPDGRKVFVADHAKTTFDAQGPVPAGGPAPAAGQPAAAAAGTPGAPAAARKRTDPFLTPDQLMQVAAQKSADKQSTADLNATKRQAQSDYDYGLKSTNDSAGKASHDSQEDAAARGIFQSSIKDASLYDIEAQRVTIAGRLKDTLDNINITADAKLNAISGAASVFDTQMATVAAGNAAASEAQVKPDAPADAAAPDAAAAPAAPAAPAASGPSAIPAGGPGGPGSGLKDYFKTVPAKDSHGNPGVWHVYLDGHRVWVAHR